MDRSSEFQSVARELSRATDLPPHKGEKLMNEGILPVIADMARRGLETDARDLYRQAAVVMAALNEAPMFVREGAGVVHSQQ